MMGANGLDVGDVFVSNGRPSTVVVNVDYWVPAGDYGIEFRTGSSEKHLGDVNITDGRGSWAGVAKLPDATSGSIVLVAADGAVVCEARLAPV
jgi:hypothetical protein